MTATVTVCCKVPNGIVMRIYDMVKAIEPSPMGGREILKAQQVGADIKINGATTPTPSSFIYNQLMHGYGVTHGVPKEAWDKWAEQNKDSALLQNKIIFAYEDSNQTFNRAAKQRKEGVKSGLEPLDPFNLPKGLSLRNMTITTADEMPPIPPSPMGTSPDDMDRTSPARPRNQKP